MRIEAAADATKVPSPGDITSSLASASPSVQLRALTHLRAVNATELSTQVPKKLPALLAAGLAPGSNADVRGNTSLAIAHVCSAGTAFQESLVAQGAVGQLWDMVDNGVNALDKVTLQLSCRARQQPLDK